MISPKVVKDLSEGTFGGDVTKYTEWHDLTGNHMLSANHGYGRVPYEVKREAMPRTFSHFQACPHLPGMTADLTWATRQLWMFIDRHVTTSMRSTLKSLVDGEELSGLEVWRILWIRHEGGAQEVDIADLGALQTFPECHDSNLLALYLGEWLTLVQAQGQDLPDRHLRQLLMNMLIKEARVRKHHCQ